MAARAHITHHHQTASSEEEKRNPHCCFGSSKAHQERSQARQEISCSARRRDGGVPGICDERKQRIDSYLVPSHCSDLIVCCVHLQALLIIPGHISSLYVVDTTTVAHPCVSNLVYACSFWGLFRIVYSNVWWTLAMIYESVGDVVEV
jgi:hypothetical protein